MMIMPVYKSQLQVTVIKAEFCSKNQFFWKVVPVIWLIRELMRPYLGLNTLMKITPSAAAEITLGII